MIHTPSLHTALDMDRASPSTSGTACPGRSGLGIFQTLLRQLFGFLILLLFPFLASAQDFTPLDQAKRKAQKAYELAVEYSMGARYEQALRQLDKALSVEPKLLEAIIQRAAIFYDMEQYEQALLGFRQALDMAPEYDAFVWYQAALSAYRDQQYKEAVPFFEGFLERAGSRDRLRRRAEDYLEQSRFAARAMADPVPFEPENLGPAINSDAPEYLPALSADGETLIFTRVVNRQEDFFYSRKDDEGNWTPSRPLKEINTPRNEGAQSLSADGRLLFFTACNRRDGYGSCDLYFSEYTGGRWTSPRNVGPPVNSRAWESQPALSADGRLLYFAARREGGEGGIDLWKSRRLADGSWSEPENMGPVINSAKDDQAPFIHPDGQTLYFISEGHPGMGESDIYLARRQPDGSWGEPQNLGYPINTTQVEATLIVSLDGQTAYYASDRLAEARTPGVPRNPDIYAFPLHEQARPQPVTYVKGIVTDARTGQPLAAQARITTLDDGEEAASTVSTPEKGAFLLVLPSGRDYALNISKEGYLFYSENFALKEQNDPGQPFRLEASLSPIPSSGELPRPDKPVVLRNVFFNTGSAELLPASRLELDRLVALLNEHPTLRIRINGHTDDIGGEADNLQLSEARARAVYDYLLKAGIAAERLRYKGFGESSPLVPNSSPENRRMNRRTEFEVLD